jgi:hypothetical protein
METGPFVAQMQGEPAAIVTKYAGEEPIYMRPYPARDWSFNFMAPDDRTSILQIAQDGFYVRGVKLEQDAAEARAVFEAFRDWIDLAGARTTIEQYQALAATIKTDGG